MNDMTELLIRQYLPHPPDPTLKQDEYFVMDHAGRIRRVMIYGWRRRGTSALFVAEVRLSKTGEYFANRRHPDGCFPMADLYDNYADCAALTHYGVNRWEWLREQQKERIQK